MNEWIKPNVLSDLNPQAIIFVNEPRRYTVTLIKAMNIL